MPLPIDVVLIFAFAASSLAPEAISVDESEAIEKETPSKIRGITISTHGIGLEWNEDRIVPTLEAIRDVGGNWIAIHPYAQIGADGSVRANRTSPEKNPGHMTRPIKEAKALGLRVFIKPHLSYWGSPFNWRGDIEFDTEEKWNRFFATYTEWIVSIARLCDGMDGFAVGTELDKTAHREEWLAVIKGVREATSASLTYAANWYSFDSIPFWNQLDVIGVQAYFPVADKLAPETQEIEEGWRSRMDELRAISHKHSRSIVFTELGYSESIKAALEPWAYEVDDDPRSLGVKSACLRCALEAIEREESVLGSFLWKWFPHPSPNGRNFRLATPEMTELIKAVWIPR